MSPALVLAKKIVFRQDQIKPPSFEGGLEGLD